MQFKAGVPTLAYGKRENISYYMQSLSAELLSYYNRILFIDTTNSLNPHLLAYRTSPADYFKRIYCVRTPRPYDLWARLGTADNFIKLRKIDVLLINSLTSFFEDSEEEEAGILLSHMLDKIKSLTKKHNLVTIIGAFPESNGTAMKASDILLHKANLAVI